VKSSRLLGPKASSTRWWQLCCCPDVQCWWGPQGGAIGPEALVLDITWFNDSVLRGYAMILGRSSIMDM
jgi:hypothetical protein